jgi:uncharacterized protein YgiM (DUF1202 family)
MIMRRLLLAIVLSVVTARAAAAETGFPYQAVVTTDNIYVRSGPGENFYPTDRLKAGQAVEVYRHDAGGWYAIRPPAGSFSWVAGSDLEPSKDNLARVAEEHVPARVGSRFSDIREVTQVRLKRGEVVEVLGAKSRVGAETWYKIAPPAGEFRWVDGKHVARADGADGPGRPAAGGATGAPPASGRLSPEQFQKAMADLEIELSTMVVEEPTVWDFAELRQRADSLFQQAETPTERGQARLVLGKISRFDDIRERYKKVSTAQAETPRLDRRLARLSPGGLPSDPSGRLDVVGRLAWVPSPKAGSPQYVVMDPSGNVRCYVSPAPGVNLRYFVGRDVRIDGTPGYMFEQKAAHLMARHVTLVDEATLR